MIAVFDGHNDALTRDPYVSLATDVAGRHINLPKMRAGHVRGGIFAVFTSSGATFGEPVPREDGVIEIPLPDPIGQPVAAAAATRAAGRLHALERAGELVIARGVDDLDAARTGNGPPVAVLHLEGAEAIDPGLEALEHWYAAGLRSLGPVWSRPTAFGHGVPFISPSSPDTGPGLTEPGLALVQRCAELGIAVDLSHLNEAGFWDVARLDRGPLIASHSAAHALCPASRNLTDRQLDAIGSSGGLVGIVYACLFLRADFADTPDTPIELIVAHARYVADRIGTAHVALGSDFDGAIIPAALGDASGLPRLLAALSDDGFSDAEVEAIAWTNWRRVLAAWWH
ncbi:MAG TPA: dipeptidase [Solirubrobacteraceae bacterium]|jgi:membrane dipeptidase|nr:dipeptidase [Solirubrobacteraceae bacterium]